jgi:hypothetical protein
MRRLVLGGVTALCFLPAACDVPRGPRLAVGPDTSKGAAAAAPAAKAHAADHAIGHDCTVYCGHTPEEWGKALQANDRAQVVEACRALRVLGPEGRPHLWQGLGSPQAETRRLCLESLTTSDFKKQGEAGRQMLVKLAGDRSDIRIRERATAYLGQWHGTIPSP